MRAIPPTMNAAIVSEVDDRLSAVEVEHGVRIPWAIESGSRAWGFPSPDSDYDCRFIFVRPRDGYLNLWPARDVIETPLDKVFDVNGWDLAKAVRLIARGNATAIEWLRSPIVYRGDPSFRAALLALSTTIVERGAVGRHYLHVGRQQQSGAATLKRFFYVLRPTAALRWLHTHPGSAVPPMDLPTLLAEGDVEASVLDAATELIALKALTREMGRATPPAVLENFVATELERGEQFESLAPEHDPARVRAHAERFFRSQLQ